MVNDLSQIIYDNTFSIIRKAFEGSTFEYEISYKRYLAKKYEEILEEFAIEESEDMLKNIISMYIDDELKLWKSLNKNEMLEILDEDPAYEHLKFLSDAAYQKAKESVMTGKYMEGEGEYQSLIEEVVGCLDKVKPHNIDNAKDLVSEAILDIDCLFGKSEVKSFRLSSLI